MQSGVSVGEAKSTPPSPSSSPVVVFDFDGTLVSRDSFLDFSVRYCAERPGRLLLIAAMLPLTMLAALCSRAGAASVLLWGMTVGSSTRSFVVALARYARHTLPRYAHAAIFEELAHHVRMGGRVVIATGSPPILVRGLLRARHFAKVPVVGSRFRRRWGGLVVETHCIGNAKAEELHRRLDIVNWSTVYTDSFLDRTLMSRARDITLVGPSRRLVRRTRRLNGHAAVRVLPAD